MAERELRRLVPFEVLAILAIAIGWPLLAWSDLVPFAVPLLIAATLSRWFRGRSWSELAHGGVPHLAIGAVSGAVALVLAVLIGTPVVEALSGHAVEWSTPFSVSDSTNQLISFALYLAIAAIAAELALRGWIVERMLELSPGPSILPILVGSITEALLVPGGAGVRAGAALFGAGLGWMYVAGGRSIVAPSAARIVFVVGALVLEGLSVIG